MPVVPIASFLAGALLSLLIPAVLLTGLVVWHMLFIRRVPDTVEPDLPGLSHAQSLPDDVRPAAPPTPPADVTN